MTSNSGFRSRRSSTVEIPFPSSRNDLTAQQSTVPSLFHPAASSVPSGGPRRGNQFVVAIGKGRMSARDEVGMAIADVNSPTIQLAQFTDNIGYTRTLAKLQAIQPMTILVPDTMVQKEPAFYHKIYEYFFHKATKITDVERKKFNANNGSELIKRLVHPDYETVVTETKEKYYALCAFAALMEFFRDFQAASMEENCFNISFSNSETTVMIDTTTTRSLELLLDGSGTLEHSLYSFLNYTKTRGGNCFLRSSILEPPCDLETILLRQACINELSSNKPLFEATVKAFSELKVDMDKILINLIQTPREESKKGTENKIETAIYLKHILNHMQGFIGAMALSEHVMFKDYSQMLGRDDRALLLEIVNEYIKEDCVYDDDKQNFRVNKCYAIKSEVNSLLDVARTSYSEAIEDIQNELKLESEENPALSIHLACNPARGYFYEVDISSFAGTTLPKRFIKRSPRGKRMQTTTEAIMMLNLRVERSIQEIYKTSEIILDIMFGRVREHLSFLYKLSDMITKVDFYMSLTNASSVHDMVRPTFGNYLQIKKGAHPILMIREGEKVIKNDIHLYEDSNFALVMGPNMSGKSVFLKQAALLQILAQIGSFVPAEEATFRITKQIFSRVGSDDDIESGISTFANEIKETQYILANVSDDSLVVIDELGRGTSLEEGVALFTCVAEELLIKKCFVLAATHFPSLCALRENYFNVKIYQFDVDFSKEFSEVTFDHRVSETTRDTQVLGQYGIEFASMAGLPEEILNTARGVLETIATEEEDLMGNPEEPTSVKLRKERDLFTFAVQVLKMSEKEGLDITKTRPYLVMRCQELLND